MIVLEVLGRHHRNQDDLRVRHLGPDITAVIQLLHQGIEQHKRGYNPAGVHWFLLSDDLALALTIVPEELMGVN
jgi:hypothetical protein